ncbi:hypothetical protein KR51_00014480 [Rubidibacter lacunae KORDI 51-2]|uniref:YdhG-like domain-containing protein n=1 Tax=Rubidibacter lacunae KORDI 51-2 TaxID=582515 RepID=U5DMS3_9CHRO|nr:DUF1801 domain-containing protein [Rubidibacter lacunae]ERN41914.1 hypothetical protein KR51_00014480 [Rubidibacter lacunae KORDI 51-2]
MNDTALQQVEDFINDIQSVNPEHAEIIKLVRDLFAEENEEIFQGIKYGGLAFFQNGALIGGIFPYKKHLSIEFSNGADFSDPSSDLEGKGKKRRHLKIFTAEDIDAKNALYFVKQAVDKRSDT